MIVSLSGLTFMCVCSESFLVGIKFGHLRIKSLLFAVNVVLVSSLSDGLKYLVNGVL